MLAFGRKKTIQNLSIRTVSKRSSSSVKKNVGHQIEDDVLFQEFNNRGLITLNKPKVQNCLTVSMAERIHSALKQWENTKELVVIRGAGEKVFCAGGDLQKLFDSLFVPDENNYMDYPIKLGQTLAKLHNYIGAYSKPCVSLMDGIVMGAGVGLSIHGQYRVATENTVFAMPETAIGLIPDSGATYFLPRMKGKLGMYLGLTGHRLKGFDVKLASIATHYMPSARLSALTGALLGSSEPDVGKILSEFDEENSSAVFSLEKYSQQIDECFSADTVEEIIERLKMEKSTWALNVAETLEKMSPTSLKVTKAAFERGKNMSLTECLQMEHTVEVNIFSKNSDCEEGIRAVLIDKNRKPIWNPKTLAEVTDDYVESKFRVRPGDLPFRISPQHKL